nr:lymphocyte-specific helicase isoform X2 [Biomphalaria glabrata]
MSAKSPPTSSPSKPESHCASNIPEEDANFDCLTHCALLADSTRCPSPSISSSVSNEESMDSTPSSSKTITDEMVREEEQLYIAGVKEEKKRAEDEENILKKMNTETREERYERLKFLLSKSKIYSEYLVNRIKQQKIDEEKRRQQRLKKEQNKESEKEESEHNEVSTGQQHVSKGSKRKSDCLNSKAKKQKTTTSGTSSEESKVLKVDASLKASASTASQSPDSTAADNSETVIDEPALIEKALTFGLLDLSDEKRFINGVEVPYLQPKLMTGGVLRPYQVEGYSWLKVMYENAVNGILADEMGLGKTVQCIAILSHLVYMGVPGPFLICAPLSTIPNWLSEFQTFAPNVPTILYHGPKDSRLQLTRRISKKYKIREDVYVHPVVITSYEIAMIERKTLSRHEWKYLIVDEGHRIKNTHCRLIRELRMYRSTHRLLLTGTPLQNSLAELWSLLNFLLPEIFDDLGSFESWFDINCMNGAESEEKIVNQERVDSILSMMHQILSPFMLRRLKSDVDLNIPPKKEIIVYAPLTPQQKEFYSAVIDRSIWDLLKTKEDTIPAPPSLDNTQLGRGKRKTAKVQYNIFMETDQDSKKSLRSSKSKRVHDEKSYEEEELEFENWLMAVSDKKTEKVDKGTQVKKVPKSQVNVKMCSVMMQLRKCCNHPYLLEHPIDATTGNLVLNEGIITSSGKMQVLDQMLAELKRRGHRVLLFSQMTRMLDLIQDFCHIRGYGYCRLDGSDNIDDRKESMREFNKRGSDKFIFLLSTRAGGLGINLTAADTVIIFDSDWNPQCDLQAQDRCHRIGQNKPVVVYRLVSANTIDEKIIERAAAKRKLEKLIIHKGKFKSGNFMARGKAISPEELRALLQSKDHDAVVNKDDFIISESELSSLLDRSDLIKKWKMSRGKGAAKQKNTKPTLNEAAKNSKSKKPKKATAEASVTQSKLFKVIDNEAGESTDIQCTDMDSLDLLTTSLSASTDTA